MKHVNQLFILAAAGLLGGWDRASPPLQAAVAARRATERPRQAQAEKEHCIARRIVGLRHQFLACYLDFDGRGAEAIQASFDSPTCKKYCEKIGSQLPVGKQGGDCLASPLHDLNGFGGYLGCYVNSGGRELVQTPDVISEVECATLCS